jgi:hypothetical protein
VVLSKNWSYEQDGNAQKILALCEVTDIGVYVMLDAGKSYI